MEISFCILYQKTRTLGLTAFSSLPHQLITRGTLFFVPLSMEQILLLCVKAPKEKIKTVKSHNHH